MTDTTPKLHTALSRTEAMTYPCPECGAAKDTPCVASYDGHAIKGVHVKRQFPFGMYRCPPLVQGET